MPETWWVMDSLKNSFKTNVPANGGHEEERIFFKYEGDKNRDVNHREVVVKIENGNGDTQLSGESIPNENLWRESSYEFWQAGEVQNPNVGRGVDTGFYFQQPGPTYDGSPQEFTNKCKVSTAGSLDIDSDMDEVGPDWNLPTIKQNSTERSKELRVSFQAPSSGDEMLEENSIGQIKGSNPTSSEDEGKGSNDEEVAKGSSRILPFSGQVKCSSNPSSQRYSGLLSIKTKSRLTDPPQQFDDRKSGKLKSGQLKSGALSWAVDEDDDDPFSDEDLPGEFKRATLSAMRILEWVSLFIILVALVCSLTVHSLKGHKFGGLHFWKWEVLVFVLICGRLVSGWGIHLVVFFIERNFLLRKRLLYFVYGLRKAVQNCLWLGMVLLAWYLMFDERIEKETNSQVVPYVTKVLICLLVTTIIWLLKTLFVKVMASSFHVSTYFDRIQEALFNQYVIETLSGPPVIEIQTIKEEEERVMAEIQRLQNAGARIPVDLSAAAFSSKSGRVIGDSAFHRSPMIGKSVRFSGLVTKKQDECITIDHLHRLNQKNISAWNMKRLMNIVRHGVLSTLDEKLIGMDQEDESSVEIRSEYEAKIAAKKIFTNVAKAGSKYIYLVDIMRFMREGEALKAMGLFEGANDTKRVRKTALKNWVIETFRERRALALTLNDTKTAVNKLHQMVNGVVGVILVVIWLLILGIATSHFLVLMSSQLLLVVFIFGNTCKMIFEAIIFLFVMHPFDVGDRCEVDGVQMIVEEMNILTTIFLRFDNLKIAYPNNVLSMLPISNFYRSPDMGDAIDFCVHVSTPVEKLSIMKERIKGFIENKKEHWYPDPSVVIKDVLDMNKLVMAVWLRQRINFQNMGERWNRREMLVQEMIKIFRELDIEYRMLPIEVNIRNMPASTSNRLPSTWAT